MRWLFRRGLRVLMYHQVSQHSASEHTVTAAQLEGQLRWLREQEFQFVTVADVLRGVLPERSVLVTFDDAYVDTMEMAAPVLRALEVPAVVFVPTAFVGQTSAWDSAARPLMDESQLCTLAGRGFELGLHSHRHESYARLTAPQIVDDLHASLAAFRRMGLTPAAALAYPYGARPRGWTALWAMKNALWENGVRLAFRVGNRINRLPLLDPLEVERLSVRGDESFARFQRKIRWGRLLG